MRKIIASTLIVASFIFLFNSPVLAQTIHDNDSVVLSKDKVINENYFAAGESVTISGTVNGDVYVAGGTIFIDGTINGDLLAAGGTVNIDGTVSGDIRTAGGTVTVSGDVSGSVTAAGGTVNIVNTATIRKSLVATGGQISVMAPIGTSATLGGGHVVLGNSIGGNVLAGVGNLIITQNASVKGNVQYYSDKNVEVQNGAQIAGKIQRHEPPQENYDDNRDQAEAAISGVNVMYKLISGLVAFIIGFFFIKTFPMFTKKAVDIIETNPLKTMGVGILVLIGLPILAVILLISLIGIPFGVFLIFAYIIYIYLAKVFVAMYLGVKASQFLNQDNSLPVSLLIGLLIWFILTTLPVLGFFVHFIVTITGMGAFILAKTYYFNSLKTKKLL